jgi:hypothetical protein
MCARRRGISSSATRSTHLEQTAHEPRVGTQAWATITRLTAKRLRITNLDGSRALQQIWVVGAAGSSAAGTGLSPVATTTDFHQP